MNLHLLPFLLPLFLFTLPLPVGFQLFLDKLIRLLLQLEVVLLFLVLSDSLKLGELLLLLLGFELKFVLLLHGPFLLLSISLRIC